MAKEIGGLLPKQASCFPSEYPAQNISSYNSTKMFFFLCHLMHSVAAVNHPKGKNNFVFSIQQSSIDFWHRMFILIIGTEAVCKIAVPVCPEERSEDVLPQPAIIPRRPVRSMFVVGKQIGKMWFLK